MMNFYNFISSFIFLTNVFNNYLHKYYLYSALFFLLFITSVIHHYYCMIETNLIDKISILGIVLYGGQLYYKKMSQISNDVSDKLLYYIPLLCFWATIFLYLYGDITDSFCFNKNKEIGNKWHSALHFISSIGHHAIVLI